VGIGSGHSAGSPSLEAQPTEGGADSSQKKPVPQSASDLQESAAAAAPEKENAAAARERATSKAEREEFMGIT
jgi:hypothetical protein